LTLSVLSIEHDFLSVARALFGLMPRPAVRSLLIREASGHERRQLSGLTPNALTAFRQTLARGGARVLLRGDGWRRRRRFGGAEVVSARLWETEPAPLAFTTASFGLVQWLTLEPVGRSDSIPHPGAALDGPGDELTAYLACALLADLGLPLGGLAKPVDQSALAQIAFVDALREETDPDAVDAGRTAALLDMPVLLEALETDLARALVSLEERKAKVCDPSELQRIGRRAEAALDALLAAAEQRGRLDQLGFLARACTALVERGGSHPQLASNTTLQSRQLARRASAGVLRAAARLADAHRALRHVGFVDDEYDRAQALLAEWEELAPALGRASDVAKAWAGLPGGAPEADAGADSA
jgi:hypothetical protein